MLKKMLAVLASVGAITAPLSAAAQEYPSRPIRVVVPFGPGAPDTLARIIGQQLPPKWASRS